MTQPINTPGPLKVVFRSRCIAIYDPDYKCAIAESGHIEQGMLPSESMANARLLAAAYNAFDSAGRALDCNAVDLAERMAGGGIAELVEAVKAAKEMSDWFMEHSRQADHAHSELKQPLHETEGWNELIDAGYNGLMASYHGQFDEAIAKVKGGAL